MNLQSHFAPMKSAQIPTNSISKHSKLIQLFEFGGAFIIPSKLCRASQDRSRFVNLHRNRRKKYKNAPSKS